MPEETQSAAYAQAAAIPPRSLEAERSVLGEIMVNNTAWDTVEGVVRADDFYDAGHKKIFRCITELMGEGTPADIITVAKRLRDADELEQAGGTDALTDMASVQSGTENLKGHARVIRDCAVLRDIIGVTEQIRESAFHPKNRTVREVIDEAESRLLAVSADDESQRRTSRQIGDFSYEVTETIDRLSKRKDKSLPTGVPTGLIDLDRLTSGLQPGELVIIAGRPSMGKTALALDIARHVADPSTESDHGGSVLMFSLEMSAPQLLMRLLGNVGQIDQHKLRSGDLSEREADNLTRVIGQIEGLNFHVDDSSGIDVMQVKARSRRMQRKLRTDNKPRLGMILIDYLQLVGGEPGSNDSDNRAQSVAAITRGLKALARELDVVVVALSQLNRALETRNNRRPMMSDLRESGAIEQDADLIMFLYRDYQYSGKEEDATKAEIIVGKHRNGPTGMVNATFLARYASFRNYAPTDPNDHLRDY